MIVDLAQQLESCKKEVELIIKPYFPTKIGYPDTIIEAMIYSLESPGKRIRPMMMRESFRLFGGKGKVIEPFMAALEMIHTYSLIHDDLPAMDNDEYRRGRKTTHIVYGEDMAILAGDGLLNYAYETAMKAFEMEADKAIIARALQVLGQKAGIFGMVGGQVVDIESEGKVIDQEQLLYIYKNKTAALLEAALMIGSILAGATKNEQKAMEKIAEKVGLAFQIQDDILDVCGTMEELGKPIGSDEKNNKVTYVSLHGMENAQKMQKQMITEAVELLDALVVRNDFLKSLLISLMNRKH